jgi:tetratricopeptide (TPR) repeat protein
MRMRMAVAVAILLLGSNVLSAQRNAQRDLAMPSYKAGLDHMRSESWDKAAEAFRQATDTDPAFEMAFYALGKANMARKRYVDAATALTKCRDLYLAQTGRQFASQQDAQRYRRDRIMEIDELIRHNSSGAQTQQTQEAIRQLTERRRQLQDDIQRGTNVSFDATVPAYVSVLLGSAYFRMERFADAEREYKAAVAADPKTGEAHNNLAVVYLQTGRIEEAEKSVKAAEKTGFRVNPMLKEDIAARKKTGSN